MAKIKVINIIPTFNEKGNILPMLKTLKKISTKNKKYDFATVVVDDNSPDGTNKLVKLWQKKDKTVHLLTGPKKGLGYALIRGYHFALNKLKADIIIPNDCDFSWDPQLIPSLLKKINQGYDVVVASRYLKHSQTQGWSTFRKLNHWISNVFFATWVAGIHEIQDHNGNFKAIRVKNVLDQIPLKKLLKVGRVHGFAFQPFIYYELSKITQKFCEIPAVFKFRTVGEAKISAKYMGIYQKDAREYAKLCLLIRRERLRKILGKLYNM